MSHGVHIVAAVYVGAVAGAILGWMLRSLFGGAKCVDCDRSDLTEQQRELQRRRAYKELSKSLNSHD